MIYKKAAQIAGFYKPVQTGGLVPCSLRYKSNRAGARTQGDAVTGQSLSFHIPDLSVPKHPPVVRLHDANGPNFPCHDFPLNLLKYRALKHCLPCDLDFRHGDVRRITDCLKRLAVVGFSLSCL
jgi:hypothetical protein